MITPVPETAIPNNNSSSPTEFSPLTPPVSTGREKNSGGGSGLRAKEKSVRYNEATRPSVSSSSTTPLPVTSSCGTGGDSVRRKATERQEQDADTPGAASENMRLLNEDDMESGIGHLERSSHKNSVREVIPEICLLKFLAELRFWAVSKNNIDECCSPFSQYIHSADTRGGSEPEEPAEEEKDHFIGVRCANVRRRLWLILEGHTQSKWWKAFEIVSTAFVVLSISALILGSIPEFQVPQKTEDGHLVYATATYPTYPNNAGIMVESKTVIREGNDNQLEMQEHPVFNYVENICVVYFSLEYAVRFAVAPRKLAFARQALNVIDLLSIVPFYFEILLLLVGISGDNVRKIRWAFLTVRLLRVLRVIRLAKLGRFSPGLANFALTLRKSKKQMQMVGVILITTVIFFSTLIYFLERDEPDTKFYSIPAAFWWCAVTMSTVGYGDLVPTTSLGKMVGSITIASGVLTLALPITIIVINFLQIMVKLQEEKIVKKYYAQHQGEAV